MCMLYIIEILYSIFVEFVVGKDLILLNNKLIVFLYLIPTKIIEIIISLKGDTIMKLVVGGVVRK